MRDIRFTPVMQVLSSFLCFIGLALIPFLSGCGSDSSSSATAPELIVKEVTEMTRARENRKQLLDQNLASSEGVSILVEVIEAPHSFVTRYLAEHPVDENDANQFRQEVQIWLKTHEAEVRDFAVIHGNFEIRSRLKSMIEIPGFHGSVNGRSVTTEDNWNGKVLTVIPMRNGRNQIDLELSTESWESQYADSPVVKSVQATVRNGSYAFLDELPPAHLNDKSQSDQMVQLTFIRADSF